MGLFLATVFGFLVWIVLWAFEVKAFDAFMITLGIILVAASLRMLTPRLTGKRA